MIEAASATSLLTGRPVAQIGLLVCDFERALERYTALWGIDAWDCYTYGPDVVRELTYRGRPGTYSMRIALSRSTPQLELIYPLIGPSIYEEWLETRGPGLHHLGLLVEQLRPEIERMTGAGYELLQSGYGYGLDGDGGYAYFDTVDELDTIVELIERPRRRRDPELVWP